jgi:glycosyltransferase involved in cell wall biosynthesis/predicted SAM-dependent methyltransferase
MPTVSVIMPSYNHARYVGMAINSVLGQSLQDIELIVIDDGSTDGTQDILRGIKDERVRCVLRDRNVGASQGSNEGLAMARSPYVAMISSDDLFAPTKLERQLAEFNAGGDVTAVFCVPRLIDGAGNALPAGTHFLQQLFVAGRWTRAEVLRRLFRTGNFFCHPSVMVRREVYGCVGPYDIRMSSLGDLDMWMRMAIACAGDFVTLDGELVDFRIHDGNASAPTVSNVQCGLNEWPLIVGHVRNLREQPDVFRATFPDAGEWMRGSTLDVEFALSQLAIRHHVRSIRGYGIGLLYELMGDDHSAGVLRDKHGFTSRDLIRLSQATDATGETATPVAPALTARRTSVRHRIAREARRLSAQVQSVGGAAAGWWRRVRVKGGGDLSTQKPGYTEIRRAPMSTTEAAAVTDSYLRGRSDGRLVRGVHLGCGDQKLDGWLNVDLGGRAEVVWDLTMPFRWAREGAFDYCFSEHVLEHFPRQIGLAILREAHRILRVGGVVRISIPDLKNVVAMYCDESFLDADTVANDVIAPTAAEAVALFGSSYGTRGERLNVCMYGWGHAYLYDEEDLTRVLAEAGFTDMRRCRHSESSHPGLCSLETRPQFQSALTVEGTKA